VNQVFISLGGNIGDSYSYINFAIDKIKEKGIDVLNISSFYVTEAWGKADQDDFLNCVVEISTVFNPWQLLDIFQKIERDLGKDIKVRWGERTIDIDIILFGEKVIYEKKIIIPHERYHKRNFVLIPLCEISKDIVDPLKKQTSGQLLQKIKDTNEVKLYNES